MKNNPNPPDLVMRDRGGMNFPKAQFVPFIKKVNAAIIVYVCDASIKNSVQRYLRLVKLTILSCLKSSLTKIFHVYIIEYSPHV